MHIHPVSHLFGKSQWFCALDWLSFCYCSMDILFQGTVKENRSHRKMCLQILLPGTFCHLWVLGWMSKGCSAPLSTATRGFCDSKTTFPCSTGWTCPERRPLGVTPAGQKSAFTNSPRLFCNVNLSWLWLISTDLSHISKELSASHASKGHFKTWALNWDPALMRTGVGENSPLYIWNIYIHMYVKLIRNMKNYIIPNQTTQTESMPPAPEGWEPCFQLPTISALLSDCLQASDPSFSAPVFTTGILQIQHEVLLNTHVSINIYLHRVWLQCLELLCQSIPESQRQSFSQDDFFCCTSEGIILKCT